LHAFLPPFYRIHLPSFSLKPHDTTYIFETIPPPGLSSPLRREIYQWALAFIEYLLYITKKNCTEATILHISLANSLTFVLTTSRGRQLEAVYQVIMLYSAKIHLCKSMSYSDITFSHVVIAHLYSIPPPRQLFPSLQILSAPYI
jgi:hypothetical protein